MGGGESSSSPPTSDPINLPILGQIPRSFAPHRSTICKWIPRYCWQGTGTGSGSMGGGVATLRGTPQLVISKSQYPANDSAESILI